MTLEDFADLEIGLYRRDDVYSVEFRFKDPGGAIESRAGVDQQINATFDQDQLRELANDPTGYGQYLSVCLFGDPEAKEALAKAQAISRTLGVPLRIHLFIDSTASELHNLSWETLTDPSDGSPLGTNENILFSRFLSSTMWGSVPLRSRGELTALALIANPSDLEDYQLAPLNLTGELERVRSALAPIPLSVLPNTKKGRRASAEDLFAHLRDHRPDLLYLICHGSINKGQPWLWLEGKDGKVKRLSSDDLVQQIKELQQLPRLIILSSCDSAGDGEGESLRALGPKLTETGVPAVIAMQGKISVETISTMMPIFFKELQKDGLVDRALAVARGAVRTESDHWMPVLFLRLRDGRLWTPAEDDTRTEAPSIFHGVPSRPPQFIGRQELLDRLIERLLSGDTLAISAEGMPGVGKTTLAIAIAHHPRIRAHFKDGVLWGGLGRQPDVMRLLADWADALGVDISDLLTVEERSQAVRDAIGQRRMLLVIDDAWTLEPTEYLKSGGPNCCHLLTTRDKVIAHKFTGAKWAETIPTLRKEPSFELLQALAPEACEADPGSARSLAQAVGGLPLALELLGGYLAAPERSYFPELSQEAFEDLADPQSRLALATKRLGTQGGKAVTLEDTISLSLEELPANAARAFSALGAFAPKPKRFEKEAALAVTNADPRDLAVLISRNLVEIDEKRLTLHQTLSEVARIKMDKVAETRHWEYYLELVNEDPENWRRIEAVYGQIQWAWEKLPAQEVLLDYIKAIFHYQKVRGLWLEYIAWAKRGLEFAKAEGMDRDVGKLTNNLGLFYNNLGQSQEALEHFEQALRIQRELGDRDGLAGTLNNIGSVYWAIGQAQTALEYYEQAVPIFEELGDSAGLARALNNIGTVYHSLGQLQEALKYFEHILPFREEVGDRSGVATTLNNIGAIYRALGQPQEGLEYYQRALVLAEEVGDRSGIATTLVNIGGVYDRLGQPEKALETYERVLPIFEKMGNRFGLASTLNNIGGVYYGLGLPQKAIDYYEQALSIFEEVGNLDRLAITLVNIGLAYDKIGQPKDALVFFKQALPIYGETRDFAGMAITLNNIGMVYSNLGKPRKALKYYKNSRPIIEALGDRPGLAATLNNIGLVYNNLDKTKKALKYYEQALPIQEEIGDKNSESNTRYNIALLYRKQGRLVDAVGEIKKVIVLDEELQHPDLDSDRALLAELETELAKQSDLD